MLNQELMMLSLRSSNNNIIDSKKKSKRRKRIKNLNNSRKLKLENKSRRPLPMVVHKRKKSLSTMNHKWLQRTYGSSNLERTRTEVKASRWPRSSMRLETLLSTQQEPIEGPASCRNISTTHCSFTEGSLTLERMYSWPVSMATPKCSFMRRAT